MEKAVNTTLEEDGKTVLACWTAMGGKEDKLRKGNGDDVSKWYRVTVTKGRVTQISE